MRYQDYMIDATQKAADEAFRYAASVPEDKAAWAPLEGGRTVLDLAREMAKCPVWARDLVTGNTPEWNEEFMAAQKAEMESWKTVADCQKICNENLVGLFEAIKNTSDDRLKETKWLPYDGGRDFTVAEMMDYPRWNFTYHLGQIGYIQTLYGDKDMH